MPGLLSMYLGPLGGGKTTRAAWKVRYFRQYYPWVPVVSNVPIEGAIYVPDVIRFLAVKMVKEGNLPGDKRVYMMVILDEASSSGFESRGSGFSPGDTTLLQFARKLKVDIDIISQLLSMVDKRGQWLASFYILCKAISDPDGSAVRFEYKIYDEALEYQKTEYLDAEFCKEWIFPTFDTYDVPNYDEIAAELIQRHKIKGDDMADYERIVRQYAGASVIRPRDRWLGTRFSNFWENAPRVAEMPVFEARQVNREMPKVEARSIPSPMKTADGRSADELLRG